MAFKMRVPAFRILGGARMANRNIVSSTRPRFIPSLLKASACTMRFGLFSLSSPSRLFTSASSFTSSTGTCSATETDTGECPAKSAPVEYFRSDYKPSPYSISQINLDFQLNETETVVTSKLSMVFNLKDTSNGMFDDIVLNGEEVQLTSLSINNTPLSSQQYVTSDDKLTVPAATLMALLGSSNKITQFDLTTKVRINPAANLALSGLYKSGESSLLCTQCEAMGFRRITYFLDRPDILSVYTVRLEGDKTKYPLLLSNGNKIASGDVSSSNRHYAVWQDPFPKPSYLFALIAGDLASIHDTYLTMSGRTVQLGIYSDKENGDKLDHAMYSLKESMKWDEDTFGLECDLDIYNVVATNDFNMGAM
jgi:aminopeptidase N